MNMNALLLIVLALVWWGIPVLIAKVRNNDFLPALSIALFFYAMNFPMEFLSGCKNGAPVGLLLAARGFAMYMAFPRKDFSSGLQKRQKPALAKNTEAFASDKNPQ